MIRVSRTEHIIRKDEPLELTGCRHVFFKNIGDTDCMIGQLPLVVGDVYRIELTNATLIEAELYISFDGPGQNNALYVEKIIFKSCSS